MDTTTATTATYQVPGIHCQHCVDALTKEIGELDGVHRVDVDLATSAVTVTSARPLDRAVLADAVYDAGYDLAG
jgi:copper chaperone